MVIFNSYVSLPEGIMFSCSLLDCHVKSCQVSGTYHFLTDFVAHNIHGLHNGQGVRSTSFNRSIVYMIQAKCWETRADTKKCHEMTVAPAGRLGWYCLTGSTSDIKSIPTSGYHFCQEELRVPWFGWMQLVDFSMSRKGNTSLEGRL